MKKFNQRFHNIHEKQIESGMSLFLLHRDENGYLIIKSELKYCKKENMEKLSDKINIGCGRNILPKWINLDYTELPGVDIVFDLESCTENQIPIPDDSINEILLSHVVEHIKNVLPMMQELYRISKSNAKMIIRVPYGSSDDAFEDPTHIRQLFIRSFGYFSQPFYWRADYGYRGDWQVKKITLAVEKTLGKDRTGKQIMDLVMHQRNIVKEMIVEMIAIKPIRSAIKDLQEMPEINIQLL